MRMEQQVMKAKITREYIERRRMEKIEELNKKQKEIEKRLEERKLNKIQTTQRNEKHIDCSLKHICRKTFDSVVKVNYKEKFIIDEDEI